MNVKVRNAIFFLMVFALIFDNIPKPVQLNFLGGPAGGKLVVYPLLVGFLYSFYCHYKQGGVFVDFRKFARYVAVFIGVMLLSTVAGLVMYPYWDLVLSGPVNQIEKLPRVMDFLAAHGMAVDQRLLMSCWIAVRQVKGVFLEAFWCFGTAYLVYCWYKEDWRRAVDIVTRAVLASGVVLISYSVIESFYLAHSKEAGHILSTINPYIHEIQTDGKWWPPLLWKGQLRSVFAEPSYYGIYMAFAMPWLWYRVYQKRALGAVAVTFLLTFFLIFTKSRTAFMLHVGELTLFVLFILLWDRNKKSLLHVGKVMAISLCAFFAAMGFIGHYVDAKPVGNVVQQVKNKTDGSGNVAKKVEKKSAGNAAQKIEKKSDGDATKVATNYIKSNAASLANPDARSNGARYSVMAADFRIGLDHPVLGVGKGLRSSYMPDYFSEKALRNGEVKMWMDFRKKMGVIRSGFPNLGEYTSRFSETGLIGLGVFLAPVIVLLYGLYKKIRESEERFFYIVLGVTICGVLASGIGDGLNITYGYWLLLGLAFAAVKGEH